MPQKRNDGNSKDSRECNTELDQQIESHSTTFQSIVIFLRLLEQYKKFAQFDRKPNYKNQVKLAQFSDTHYIENTKIIRKISTICICNLI